MQMPDDEMVELLMLVEQHGGEIRTQPGELIVFVARLLYGTEVELSGSDKRYVRTAMLIRLAEASGLLLVERVGWSRAERGNRVSGVRLAI